MRHRKLVSYKTHITHPKAHKLFSGVFLDIYRSSDSEVEIPPHCHITLKCTREIAGFNALGEAVRRLDFRSAVKDRKRFQYICALLRMLVAHKGIASLPGGAQRLLLQMVEEVACHGEWENCIFGFLCFFR